VAYPPTISIEHKAASKNPRSTVGTITEIYDFLRVFYARLGVHFCHVCDKKVGRGDAASMVEQILGLPEGTKALALWSLRNDPDFRLETFDMTVFMAIDGLRLKSGYNDLVKALLIANLAINKGSGACKILNTFLSRGFDAFVKGISCGEYGS
jgi:hypothetical protein